MLLLVVVVVVVLVLVDGGGVVQPHGHMVHTRVAGEVPPATVHPTRTCVHATGW